MDAMKKRKIDENGNISFITERIAPEDARKMLERFSTGQLLDVLQNAVARHPDVLDAVRLIADSDASQRKLFVRGLGWDTTSEKLRDVFSNYGEIEEAVVILDKNTGKSKGYGFVIYRHVDGAIVALKEPSKKIDGRVTVTQLASSGNSGSSGSHSHANSVDVTARKIYVANVPTDMPPDKLLAHFAQYGEIEEGPLGFDKLTGKSKGFALFVYKTTEGAQASLAEPLKMLDGRQLNCKLAIDGKKGKPGGGGGGVGGSGHGNQDGIQSGHHGNGMGMGMNQPSGYGGPGMGSYGGFSGGIPQMASHQHPMSSSMGGPGLPPSVPGNYPGSGGYGGNNNGGMGAPYGGYGAPGSSGYGGYSTGSSGGSNSSMTAVVGGGSSFYRMPHSSVGLPSGFSEVAPYGVSSASASFSNQHQGTSPAPRPPAAGVMYPNFPPYF